MADGNVENDLQQPTICAVASHVKSLPKLFAKQSIVFMIMILTAKMMTTAMTK